MERLELIIRGRVQGVAFRWYAQRAAQARGVRGWVRNQPDGSVRLVAEGEREALEGLRLWAQTGPEHARVDRLEEFWGEASGAFTTFEITG